ncbi:MAG: prolipoprotein diacylglyceryl transferase [Evtepia sp.]
MNVVTFPGFGLEFHLKQVAFTVMGHSIYWYGIIIALGFALGAMFCWKYAACFGIRQDDLVDMLLFATPAAIIGARIYYVIFYLDRFRNPDGTLNIPDMFRIHNGGIAIYGAIIAAAITCYLVTRYKKLPFFAMADLCVFGLLIGQLVGRWGNFINVEAYGRETSLPWRMGIYDIVNGAKQYLEVHPTFLYESLWNLLGLILLFVIFKKGLRRFDGMFFFAYVAWYGFGRGLIEGLRTDSLYFYNLTFFGEPIRTSQMLGFLTCIVALVYLVIRLWRHPNQELLYVKKIEKEKSEESANDNP